METGVGAFLATVFVILTATYIKVGLDAFGYAMWGVTGFLGLAILFGHKDR